MLENFHINSKGNVIEFLLLKNVAMGFEENEKLIIPTDDTVIWRYIDLHAFVYMLQNSKLYFRRIDKFEDPFEGTPPKIIRDIYDRYVKKLNECCLSASTTTYENERRKYREFLYVNAWHMNPIESSAMWEIYSCQRKGIAIKSTVKNLKESFHKEKEDIHIGQIIYLDYETEEIPQLGINVDTELNDLNIFHNAIIKRQSFEFERELRAIFWFIPKSQEIPPEGNSLLNIKTNECYAVDIDLDILIENIYVAPLAEEWILKIVQELVKDYSFKDKVKRSVLGVDPNY